MGKPLSLFPNLADFAEVGSKLIRFIDSTNETLTRIEERVKRIEEQIDEGKDNGHRE